MPTFKAVVLKHQKKADKTYNVKIRVTHKRKSKYIDTGISVLESDLTKKMTLKTVALVVECENRINKYRNKCNLSSDKIQFMDIEQLMHYLSTSEFNAYDIDFISFSETVIQRLESSGQRGTSKIYSTSLNTLKRFIKNDRLPVPLINLKFIKDFAEYILTEVQQKKGSKPTRAVSLYIGCFKALYNQLKSEYNDEDFGIIRIPFSPFSRFKMPDFKPTRKRALAPDVIRAIWKLEDMPVTNSTGYNRFNLAKDCFLLSFGLIGMNSADIYNCTEYNKGWISYKRQKTFSRRKDEAIIKVFVQPQIQELFNKYHDVTGKRVFNFYQRFSNFQIFNKSLNIGLKSIGKIESIKVDDLQFYAARHSWATIAMNKVGIDKYTVHAALNHADEAMRVTDIYIEKDWSIINEANKKVLEYVFKLK